MKQPKIKFTYFISEIVNFAKHAEFHKVDEYDFEKWIDL